MMNKALPRLRIAWAVVVLVLAAAGPSMAQQLQPLGPNPNDVSPAEQPRLTAPVPGGPGSTPLMHRVQAATDRIDMLVNTSRILTMDQKIPQAQVNNPEILDVVPLSPTQVQISAKRVGITQVNLWGEDKQIHSVDVIVHGDARELQMTLRAEFPRANLSVRPVGSAVLISGTCDQQDNIPSIISIAKEFYPKVINNMTVSGVQQVVLHVKVMEVSRTKLRSLGFDFAAINNGNLVMSGISGLMSTAGGAPFGMPGGAPDQAFKFSVLGNHSAFFGVIEAMREDKLAKVLAEPNLIAVSGRPAYFLQGGEFGYSVSNISGTTVEFKEYGTRVDFVPVVLGGGRIRLEVRPRVSQRDDSNAVMGIPALKKSEVETGVEVRAGQTLAIAGLVQQRVESQNIGFPWISEIPYLGAAFRKVREEINEVELLVMVTPELIDPMDADQVPPCGPGSHTTSPSDWELYAKGYIEVPKCCPTCEGGDCPNCGAGPQGDQGRTQPGAAGTAGARPRSPYNPQNPPRAAAAGGVRRASATNIEPGFIGPIGYDVLN